MDDYVRSNCGLMRFLWLQYVEYFIDRGPLGVGKDIHHLILQHIGSDIEPDSDVRFSSSPETSSVIPTDTKEKTSKLIIPVCPPTLIGMCRLIQIYYVLKVCTIELYRLRASPSIVLCL